MADSAAFMFAGFVEHPKSLCQWDRIARNRLSSVAVSSDIFIWCMFPRRIGRGVIGVERLGISMLPLSSTWLMSAGRPEALEPVLNSVLKTAKAF